MSHYYSVECLIDRSWNHMAKAWEGSVISGILIDFATQSAEDNSGKLMPVGIVRLETGKLECIPLDFISW